MLVFGVHRAQQKENERARTTVRIYQRINVSRRLSWSQLESLNGHNHVNAEQIRKIKIYKNKFKCYCRLHMRVCGLTVRTPRACDRFA